MLALAIATSGALTGSAWYPQMGWLAAGFLAQAALGVRAVVLLITCRAATRSQHVAARLGWAVVALSAASLAATTLLGMPA